MEDDSSKRGVVIKGPWKGSKVKQEISSEIDVREDLKMIAEMHKVLLHQYVIYSALITPSVLLLKCSIIGPSFIFISLTSKLLL